MNIKNMIAVVQHYINVRKNITVNIEVNNMIDVMKLSNAYNIAMNWFESNNYKIELL